MASKAYLRGVFSAASVLAIHLGAVEAQVEEPSGTGSLYPETYEGERLTTPSAPLDGRADNSAVLAVEPSPGEQDAIEASAAPASPGAPQAPAAVSPIPVVAAASGQASFVTAEADPDRTAAAPARPIRRSALSRALGEAAYAVDAYIGREEFSAQIKNAVKSHPVMRAEDASRNIARAELRAARAALYPRLSANLSGDYAVAREFGAGTNNVVDALRPRRQFNAGLGADQLLFDGGATFARIRAARARTSEAAHSLSARINDLALSALSTYHDVVTHQAIIALGADYIERHKQLLADVKERERLGAGSQADVLRVRARLAAAMARVNEIEESARLAEIRYEEFFGMPPGRLRSPSFDGLLVNSRDEAAALALERNPDIAVALAQAKAAAEDHRAAKGSRFPEVRANANAVKYGVFGDDDDYDVRVGVNVNYDLFDWARGANIKAAAGAAEQADAERERVRREVERDAAIAFERQSASSERLEALSQAIVAHHGARDLVAERFRVARGELIDLLQAENDYFEAGVAYLAGAADRDMAIYEMMEFTGELLKYFSPAAGEGEALNG